MQYKLKHRLSAALMAGAMCCTMIPAASAEEISTPEIADTFVPEITDSVTPNLSQITENLYNDLPDAPTGSYLGSMGLPVATGETKISISSWGSDLYDGEDAHMDADALNADESNITVGKTPDANYAVVPLLVQTEYPADGAASEIILPDGVELLSYASTDYDLISANKAELAQILHQTYAEQSAAATGFYVKASADFTAQFVYTAPDGEQFSDRATLWNSVELYEKAGNAQLAREIDAALPIELSREEQIRLVREYCSSQFVSRGMCVDFAIHDTDSGNPHCHIMLTMRPLDERGAWAAKSKKEYDLDENGERIRLPSGRYKTHKVDLTGWNDKGNALLWRKAWADISNAYLERAGHPERIDHRSNAERGIDELPTVHMGVAACQMEKKGIATEKGELNRNIQKANRLIREIRAQIGKLKEWIGELFKARETAPEQPPQSPGLANLLMKYLSVQREKSRKYSQSWQRQHAADELKTVAKAVNYLSEHGISTLDELDAALSSVSDKAYSIREGMKTAEQRMKELQKLMEYGRNYQTYKPIQDEYRQIRWKGKQEKFAEARRAELTLWDAANRYLHAHLPEGVKTLPISAWEKEYTALKAQREAEYETLKDTRAEVAELQKIRKCVDIALRADQPAQTQSRTKRQEQER